MTMQDMSRTAHPKDSLSHCADLEALCRDRQLITSEIHTVNSFYGHAEILKDFLGLPAAYPLKAMIMHAPGVEHHIWNAEEKSSLPYFLCASASYAEYFNKNNKGGKVAYPIGPILSYMPDAQAEILPPANRTMAFFPVHSTHHNHATVDVAQTLRRLEPVRKKFDHCLLCIYWKDYLLGRHIPYIKEGFHCVSAGHMYDPLFLHRLRDIIWASDMVVSGRPGTEVLYAVLLSRPVWVTPEPFTLRYSNQGVQALHQNILKAFNPSRTILPKLFDKPAPTLNERQITFVGDICSVDRVLDRQQLRAILLAAELKYSLDNGVRPDPRLAEED